MEELKFKFIHTCLMLLLENIKNSAQFYRFVDLAGQWIQSIINAYPDRQCLPTEACIVQC